MEILYYVNIAEFKTVQSFQLPMLLRCRGITQQKVPVAAEASRSHGGGSILSQWHQHSSPAGSGQGTPAPRTELALAEGRSGSE